MKQLDWPRLVGISMWVLVLAFSCKGDLSDDPMPIVAFADFEVNLTAPEYQSLSVNGGYKEIGSIGVRGVILYRSTASTFLAFERNCSYRPNEACATVNVDVSKLFMVDPCCNSSFSFADGAPTGGVASRRLRIYQSNLTGNILTISSTIAN
ncbi:MAG: hypothetical protein SH819_13850 [Cytophagales bacterium]|nr:hypothetical protein [Cytophagales bacterium]